MRAKEYLIQIAKLDAVIQNKLIERSQWMDMALSITANMGGEKVQPSGAQSKMASAIDRCVDMEKEIDGLVDKLIDAKKEVVATIEAVENPTWYNLLHMRYIRMMKLEEIAERYDRDYGWATTTHGRALAAVQDILDKRLDGADNG